MTVEEVRQKCREHKLCFKCALPINKQNHTGASDCVNVTQACFYCSVEDSHVNVLCPNRDGEEPRADPTSPGPP